MNDYTNSTLNVNNTVANSVIHIEYLLFFSMIWKSIMTYDTGRKDAIYKTFKNVSNHSLTYLKNKVKVQSSPFGFMPNNALNYRAN